MFFSLLGESTRVLLSSDWSYREILRALYELGVKSVPIIAIATAFAGLVVTNEIAWHMKIALQTNAMTPGFTAQFIMRELGVAIPALLVVAKVGASIAAEIGTMKITGQIDALKLMSIRPVVFLVFPRWVACMIALPILSLISVAITLLCAMLAAIISHGFNFIEYFVIAQKFVGVADVLSILAKGWIFGAVIPLIGCAYGLECKPGAQGVGNATTQAVVAATLTVIGLDFVLTAAFAQFY